VALVDQAREVFQEVLYHLSILADNWQDFSRLATVAVELDGYHEAVKIALEQRSGRSGKNSIKLLPLERDLASSDTLPWLRIEELTLWAPSMPPRQLITSLNLDAPLHGGLLVSGASGVGKTTLLRAIAGLWLGGVGTVRRVMDPRRILFLPQQPYMQVGTLREQLVYPFSTTDRGDSELHAVIHRLGLEHVLERVGGDLNASRRWADELSIGEQQRIGIARLLVHRPAFAILDETTAANDTHHERIMYQCVLDTCQAFVSVGHRASIESFHTKRLLLHGEAAEGHWQLLDL